MSEQTAAPVAEEAPAKTKDMHLPPMHRISNDLLAPTAPQDVASARIDEDSLGDLVIKQAYTVARFSTEWVAKELHLSLPLVKQLMEQLCLEGNLEGMMGNRFAITDRGREQARRLLEICGYIGPAPVRLEQYSAMLRWQFTNMPVVTPDAVTNSLQQLVLDPEAAKLAGLAVSSGRSLFVYGPPGNGKSSLGRAIHSALEGDFWIPHAISVGTSVVRLYDDHTHQKVDVVTPRPAAIDQRWVRIRRPLVIVGGELTLEMLDLIYSPSLRYYEAPPHLKANGGVFLVDDFGRERISADQLLNRFITPMEHQHDYLTQETGQKIEIPLRHVLIIATNLSPETVTDPAFLRRIGYRVSLNAPTPEQYTRIFKMHAKKYDIDATTPMINRLLDRYKEQKRELRCCEPRDLIERSRDICRFENRELELSDDVLDLAWIGYFGKD
jgi:predicted ATPase with chaperone activity